MGLLRIGFDIFFTIQVHHEDYPGPYLPVQIAPTIWCHEKLQKMGCVFKFSQPNEFSKPQGLILMNISKKSSTEPILWNIKEKHVLSF